MSKLIASLKLSSGNLYQLNSGKNSPGCRKRRFIGERGSGWGRSRAGRGLSLLPAPAPRPPSVLKVLFSSGWKWAGINSSPVAAKQHPVPRHIVQSYQTWRC